MQKYFKHICMGVSFTFLRHPAYWTPRCPSGASPWSLPNGFTTVQVQGLVVKFEWRMTMFSGQSFPFLPNYGIIKQTIAHCHVFF